MTWFKVDDGLHAHRKAVRAGVPAMGLWVLAGSWAADQLTDGWVPDYIAARLDPDWERHAADLVRVGLWVAGEYDGDTGWWFHDWADQQPSREQVQADRKAAAERQRRARERAKDRRMRERDSQDSHAVSHAVTHAEVTPVVTVPPTRPDPTRPVVGSNEPTTSLPGGDAATRRRKTGTTPEQNGSGVSPVVAAYIDGSIASGRGRPTQQLINRVGRDAKRIHTNDGIDIPTLIAAAHRMGANGYPNLDTELQRGPTTTRATPPRRDSRHVSTAAELDQWRPHVEIAS